MENNEINPEEPQVEVIEEKPCSQCDKPTLVDDGITTETAFFCNSCYGQLRQIITNSVDEQSQNINYPGAVAGGLIGGLLGAVAWWGSTTLFNISFGLVAVLIGVAVGKGVVMLSGGKRAFNLQLIAVGISVCSYFLASYWIERTGQIKYYGHMPDFVALPIIASPSIMFEAIRTNFHMINLIFLAILVWQAWKTPAPINIKSQSQ